MMREITLPWPSRDLHPNARVHWARRAKAAKAARSAGYYAAMQSGWGHRTWPSVGRFHLWIDFYPPDRRRRDDDGLLTCIKPSRDGIADAMAINDCRFVSHPFVHDEVRKGGEVVIRITGGPHGEPECV